MAEKLWVGGHDGAQPLQLTHYSAMGVFSCLLATGACERQSRQCGFVPVSFLFQNTPYFAPLCLLAPRDTQILLVELAQSFCFCFSKYEFQHQM
jgi:hypothetical protein